MFIYPKINPIAVQLGPLKVHWYGLMYLVGIGVGWLLCLWRTKRSDIRITSAQCSDLIFYLALGVIIGGRVGYILFYNFPVFIAHPLTMFEIWDGGMSFHGGMLGVIIAAWLYGWRNKLGFFEITDFVAPVVPIGLAAGRIGNFINGELWGRVTNVPWGMVFPKVGPQPRHPSQIYEFLLEGVVLFLILWFYSAKPRPRMAVSGMFLIFYAIFRIICEFFRQPDPQLGFVAFGWVTMGQVLSIPMLILGIALLVASKYRKA